MGFDFISIMIFECHKQVDCITAITLVKATQIALGIVSKVYTKIGTYEPLVYCK